MRKDYLEPEVELIEFNIEDVIMSSPVSPVKPDPVPITDEDGDESSHYY